MRQIRRNIFESNSSSTHSLTMCLESDYDKWKAGEVYLNEDYGWSSNSPYKEKQFVTKEEVIDILTDNKYPPKKDLTELDSEDLEDIFRDNEFYTYENYWRDYFDTYSKTFTTPNGDTVVALGSSGLIVKEEI